MQLVTGGSTTTQKAIPGGMILTALDNKALEQRKKTSGEKPFPNDRGVENACVETVLSRINITQSHFDFIRGLPVRARAAG